MGKGRRYCRLMIWAESCNNEMDRMAKRYSADPWPLFKVIGHHLNVDRPITYKMYWAKTVLCWLLAFWSSVLVWCHHCSIKKVANKSYDMRGLRGLKLRYATTPRATLTQLPLGNSRGMLWNLQPLRLLLVASETTYTNEKWHSTISIIILGNLQGEGGSRGAPLCINPCGAWVKYRL